MKNINKLTDEVPSTKTGLEIYIKELEKIFKPIKAQFNRTDTLLIEAKNKLKRFK